MFLKKSSGSALISALLVTAIVSVIATAIVISLQRLIHQTELVINRDQMLLDLQGVNDWAKMVMLENVDVSQVKPLEVDINGTSLTGKIYPQQGLFNLNCLRYTKNQGRFIELIRAVLPKISTRQASSLAAAVSDWMLPGTNDGAYLRANPSYRAAHRPFLVAGSLRAVSGFTATIYEALSPYVTAFPNKRYQIDVNYAPAPIFATVGENLTLEQGAALYACRQKQKYFTNVDVFTEACGSIAPIDLDSIMTTDDYFLVRGRARRGSQTLTLTSLLWRYQRNENTKNGIVVRIVWQQLNAD